MGQTTVRKGRGNSTVSKSIFCGVFFSTYTIILGIHTYIFHNRECDFFKYFFWGGQPSDGGGHVPSVPPRDLRPWVQVCLIGFRAKLCETVALQEKDWTPPHIVDDEGLESMRYYLKPQSNDALPPSDFIVHLTE